MIKPNNAPLYAVMNENNDLVWAANHYAFYKTLKHAEAKAEWSKGRWRVVAVKYDELVSLQ